MVLIKKWAIDLDRRYPKRFNIRLDTEADHRNGNVYSLQVYFTQGSLTEEFTMPLMKNGPVPP